MTRYLLAALVLTGCAHSSSAGSVGEAPLPAVASSSAPSPLAVATPRAVPSKASRSRRAVAPRRVNGTLNWHRLAKCESSNDPHSVSSSGKYRGLYQFDLMTWRSVGGTGDPAQATAAEQTYRASLLYKARGRSPWPVCGRFL